MLTSSQEAFDEYLLDADWAINHGKNAPPPSIGCRARASGRRRGTQPMLDF